MIRKILTHLLIKFILTGFIILFAGNGFAQNKDSITKYKEAHPDIYAKLKKAFYKHKATTLLYDAVFVEPVTKSYDNKPLSDNQKLKDPNLKYEGKYVRNIYIKVFDPFGHSVHDTSRQEINSFQKLANHYHVTTHNFIVKNALLFKKNESLSILKFNESERLLRTASYVNDAQMFIEPAGNSSDSVDIKVYVHDSWALDAPVSGNFSYGDATLRDRNFLGFGQQLEQYGSYDASSGRTQFNGSYSTQNIYNSHVASSIFYTTNKDLTQLGFSLNRNFFSALTRWAGGIAMTKNWGGVYDTIDKAPYRYHLDNTITDIWVGRSFNPGWGIPVNRPNTNLIFSLRYLDNRYQSRPPFSVDTAKTNVNTTLWLSSVGFSLRKYYKDLYIYRFGANEDVPEGLLVQALYGFLYKELATTKYYTGYEISDGKHFDKLGYISVFSTYGIFYDNEGYHDATLNAGLYYFSNLLQNNKWYFRQFINFNFVDGIHKLPTETIKLGTDALYGFDAGVTGTSKMTLNLEAVTYSPHNLIGFRFAPLVLAGFGMIDGNGHSLTNSPVYKSFALGVLIRNENLINNSFQFTFGFYPDSEGGPSNLYKLNPIASFSLKVRSFAVSKPSVVGYQ